MTTSRQALVQMAQALTRMRHVSIGHHAMKILSCIVRASPNLYRIEPSRNACTAVSKEHLKLLLKSSGLVDGLLIAMAWYAGRIAGEMAKLWHILRGVMAFVKDVWLSNSSLSLVSITPSTV